MHKFRKTHGVGIAQGIYSGSSLGLCLEHSGLSSLGLYTGCALWARSEVGVDTDRVRQRHQTRVGPRMCGPVWPERLDMMGSR